MQEPDHCNVDVHIQHEYGGDELDHNAEWSDAVQYQLLQLCVLQYEEVHALVRGSHSEYDTDSIEPLLVGVHSSDIAVGVSCKCIYILTHSICTDDECPNHRRFAFFICDSNQLEHRLAISIAIVWHRVSLSKEFCARILRYHTTNDRVQLHPM